MTPFLALRGGGDHVILIDRLPDRVVMTFWGGLEGGPSWEVKLLLFAGPLPPPDTAYTDAI